MFILGFSVLLIIVLLLLTTAQKAQCVIFIFNFLSLLRICIRSIFNVAGDCTRAAYGIGENFFDAVVQYSLTRANMISFFFTVTIVTSLVLQVRVVFAAESRTQKLVTIVLSLMALWIVGLYLRFTVWEIEHIIRQLNEQIDN